MTTKTKGEIELTLNRKVKHSVRYDQPDTTKGPTTCYVPNVWFVQNGVDPTNPPATIRMRLEVPK